MRRAGDFDLPTILLPIGISFFTFHEDLFLVDCTPVGAAHFVCMTTACTLRSFRS